MIFCFFILLEVVGSVIRNKGKWFEIFMMPVLICSFKKALVRMRSIAIEFVVVTLAGLLIKGIKLFCNAKLTAFFTFKLFS